MVFGKGIRCNIIIILIWISITFYLVFKLDEELRRTSALMREVETNPRQLDEQIKVVNKNYMNLLNKILKDNARKRNHSLTINRKIKEELRKETEKWKRLSHERSKPTVRREKLRRRVINDLREIWYNIHVHINKSNQDSPETGKRRNERFLESFQELHQTTELDFDEYFTLDNSIKTFQSSLAKELSGTIQNRLYDLQNPKYCETARKLICSLSNDCGYGCQMHHLIYCFMIAYSTKRIMYIDSSVGKYSSRPWRDYFVSLGSNCSFPHSRNIPTWSSDHEKHQIVHLPALDRLQNQPPDSSCLAVPNEFHSRIQLFHGNPFVWWIGQFCKYIFKYQPDLKIEIEKKKKRLAFKKPIVGVQIRRTDKLRKEAAYHSIEEYMYWVVLHYKKLNLKQGVTEKRVFISTDDLTALSELKTKYPDYMFISDHAASITASDHTYQRYTETSLRGVISDVELLSETDYLVCTFSSNVGRLAYEMMNGKRTDASDHYKSLDDIHYFSGQPDHKVRVVRAHKARDESELNLKVGDVVGIAGNHWNGEAKGLHYKSHKTGLFPAYKVEDL